MPPQAVTELLSKQKMVEALIRSQGTLVESVTHKQHLAELHALLVRMPTAEIGRMLAALPEDDAAMVWAEIDEARHDDILWEIDQALAERLAGGRVPQFHKGRIHAYELVGGRTRVVEVASRQDFDGIQPIWIDLLGASSAEREWIARHYEVELPDPQDLTDLEVSARFYVEETGELHLHSNFLLDIGDDSRSVPVAFVVHRDILFTVRGEELPVFRLQRLRARSHPGSLADCKDLLLELYGADVEYSADALEGTYETLRQVGQQVLSEMVSDTDAARILGDIAEAEDLNGRIRGNMLDTQRAVSFLIRGRLLSGSQIEEAREIMRDIESLNSHTAFLFDKINFLMDATVGFINVNQNKRVSQLTVAGVVFMPLNVLAGIGGMSEFSMMTANVPWPLAYGALIAAMGVVGWSTYVTLRFLEKRRNRR